MNGPNGAPELLMIDLDGTLIEGYMEKAPEERDYGLVRPLSGRKEKITQLRAAGVQIAVITNQAGVAFGHQSVAEVEKKLGRVWERLGLHESGPPTSFHVCYADARAPDAKWRLDAGRRKPSPVMLSEAMAQHRIGAPSALYVGDLETDQQAAYAAGVAFLWAKDFFDDPTG